MTNPTETLPVLEKARELIARPGGWTQGAGARNAYGVMVNTGADEAVCFCAWGALRHIAGDSIRNTNTGQVRCEAYRLLGHPDPSELAEWNDAPGRTQEEVVAAFARAIATVREQIGAAR